MFYHVKTLYIQDKDIMKEVILNFRVDETLKKGFEKVAKSHDLTSSQMLRSYMRYEVDRYMKENAQQGLKLDRKGK